jgi:hypothetical protein
MIKRGDYLKKLLSHNPNHLLYALTNLRTLLRLSLNIHKMMMITTMMTTWRLLSSMPLSTPICLRWNNVDLRYS